MQKKKYNELIEKNIIQTWFPKKDMPINLNEYMMNQFGVCDQEVYCLEIQNGIVK